MKKDARTFIVHILECIELVENIFWNRFGVDMGGCYKRHSGFKEENVKNKGRIEMKEKTLWYELNPLHNN